MMRYALALLLAIFVTACTELEVRRFDGGTIEGIPYLLPSKSFVVSIQYTLEECSLDASVTPPSFKFVVGKTISVVPAIEPDVTEKYVVPYSSLHHWTKDTDITIENYDNLTLKSVNATVTDKTGETINALIGTTLRVASLAGGVRLSAANSRNAGPMRGTYCGNEAIRALDEAALLRAAIAAKHPVSGVRDPVSALEAVKAQLTYKQVVFWTPAKPPKGTSATRFEHTIYPDSLVDSQRWITRDGVAYLTSNPNAPADGKLREFSTQIALDLNEPSVGDDERIDRVGGFVLRLPILGLLRIREASCPVSRSGDANSVVLAAEHAVPQLGQYVVIPMRNGIFENQTLVVNVSAEGVLTKVGLKADAAALAAVNSLNTDLDAIAKAKDARDRAKADAVQSALSKPKTDARETKDTNNAIADCLKAQAAVVAAGGTPTGTCQ